MLEVIMIISKIYNSQRLNIDLEFISKCYSLSDNMDIRYHGRYNGHIKLWQYNLINYWKRHILNQYLIIDQRLYIKIYRKDKVI